MKNYLLIFTFLGFILPAFSQQTKVYGKVTDEVTGETLPFVKVKFYLSKMGTSTDTSGNYSIETYYATDSLQFVFLGYKTKTVAVKLDQSQEINISLKPDVEELETFFVRPPDELPSITLHKKIIANKRINNKEKLTSYDYEVYNKMQLDLNNIGEKFTERGLIQRLDVVMDYLDSTDDGSTYLPVLLSESISDFHFRNNPKKKIEIIKASKVSGIENIQINQLLGDMYLDMNIYDNYINLFQRSFVSPIANIARSYYKFVLTDSTFIDNKWCYKLTFQPKRTGDMTFSGEMWIHDTTYAVKSIKASLSPWANINYVQDMYFEQDFEQVEKEVWMQVREKMIVDFKFTDKSKLYGFFARKLSSRKDFVINQPRDDAFYNADNTVEYLDSAMIRSKDYWVKNRHEILSAQEAGIDKMVDSLNNTTFFKTLKKLSYMGATGYFPLGKIEIGSAFSLFSVNPIESYRVGLALRTSNDFSRRIELGGRIAYGFGDERFKYGASIRYNLTPKKRGMLTTFYNYDIEQIGVSPTAASVGSTFNTLFRTGPLDKLTFVEKAGINLEKDIKKDLILYGGFEWKEYTALGLANYQKRNIDGTLVNIPRIQTSEFTLRMRWTKDEEFISGAFDRSSIGSKYPIFSIQGIFGVKGIFGSDYNYQKFEFQMEHTRNVGVLGRLRYGFTAGYISGTAAYPFLKVHEGNQSYWLLTSTFNKLNYFEFISDKYVAGLLEQHWQGLLFDRIPLVKKLKWRLVTTGRIVYGSIDSKHSGEMILPTFTKQFGNVPYTELAAGIENIFKFGRIDLVYRVTHLDPGMNPIGIRARMTFSF
jgi:hypothetical protein